MHNLQVKIMIRPISSLLFPAWAILLLTSCAGDFGTAMPADKETSPQPAFQVERQVAYDMYPENKPPAVSLLDLGRALSSGQVDIYDPWASVLDVKAPTFTLSDPLVSFPQISAHALCVKEVKVYSLGTNFDDVPVQEPLPLIEPKPLSMSDKE